MPRFQKPCRVCGRLSLDSICKDCSREQERKKELTRQRDRSAYKRELYNYAYRQEAKRVKAEATHCHICNQPFIDGDRIEADHLIAGLPGSPLGAAHARCNQSRGNRPLEGLA